jgi:hypothetical protein
LILLEAIISDYPLAVIGTLSTLEDKHKGHVSDSDTRLGKAIQMCKKEKSRADELVQKALTVVLLSFFR